MEHKPFDDYVTDFKADEGGKNLVVSSGEGENENILLSLFYGWMVLIGQC